MYPYDGSTAMQEIKQHKATLTIFEWECEICKNKGKNFIMRSVHEAQIKSWRDSHMMTHKEKTKEA
jgi:hypothetical protein